MSKKISDKQKTDTSQTRKPFTEPSLTPVKPKFIEPKMTKHDHLGEVTFFATYTPD